MPVAILEKLKVWLSTYPNWEDALQVDFAEGRPAFAGLLPKSLEQTSRQVDVLGNSLVEYRYYVTLYWQMTGQKNDGESACRLLDFQNWVQEQSIQGLAPHFGDVPAMERIRTEKGGFTLGAQIATYTVTLMVDFAKVYEVSEH